MDQLHRTLTLGKQLRAIGFDDAPFRRGRDKTVNISGIVCSDTRFEGMLWGSVSQDGRDATDTLLRMITESKFYNQLHLVLTDGLTLGGFNVIDLPTLAEQLQLPCIAVMRKEPDMAAIQHALNHFDDGQQRLALIQQAGEIYSYGSTFYQVQGCDAKTAASALEQLTDTGHVPEPLRLAHMIGAAVMTGQSGKRA